MRETITAETAKVTAFTQYAIAGPEKARSPPARIGPTVQATCSTVERSDVACSRSSSPTSVREPGPDRGPEEAGRDAVDRSERDDRRGLVDERQRGEGPRADEVGDDHQPAP